MKRVLAAVILMLVLFVSVAAQAQTALLDAAQIQNAVVDENYIAANLTHAAQYLSVSYDVGEAEQPVSLSVVALDTGAPVYGKNYGMVSGAFVSDEVYLKFTGNAMDRYTVTLAVGDTAITFPFYRKLLRLSDNSACGAGLRFSDINARFKGEKAMALAVDLQNEGNLSTPVVASDMYLAGQMNVSVAQGTVTVSFSLAPEAQAEVKSQRLYILTDISELIDLSERRLRIYPVYAPGRSVDVASELAGSRYALIYLSLTLDYDPNSLEKFIYAPDNAQLDILQEMEKQYISAPVG